MALTMSKANKKPYIVKPLQTTESKPVDLKQVMACAEKASSEGSAAMSLWWGTLSGDEKKIIKPHMDEYKNKAAIVDAASKPLMGE